MPPDLKTDAEVIALSTEVATLTPVAQSIKIVSAAQYADAGSYLKRCKGALKQIEDARVRITKPLNDSLREVNAQAKEASQPWLTAENCIKRSMIAYTDEQERIRREEQRRAEEAARKERERIEAQAREAARRAQEEQERLRREAAAAEAAGRAAEAAKLAAKAVAVQEKGEAKAAALEERAACVVAPVIQREAPKLAGQRETETWHFEIVNPAAIAPTFMVPDEVKIGKLVRSMKGDAQAVLGQGVRVYSKKGLASTAA